MKRPLILLLGSGTALIGASCAKLETENTFKGDKDHPIYVVVDVNIRVDKQLDNFFSFEDAFGGSTTKPAK
jgi:hypothetical protein